MDTQLFSVPKGTIVNIIVINMEQKAVVDYIPLFQELLIKVLLIM